MKVHSLSTPKFLHGSSYKLDTKIKKLKLKTNMDVKYKQGKN